MPMPLIVMLAANRASTSPIVSPASSRAPLALLGHDLELGLVRRPAGRVLVDAGDGDGAGERHAGTPGRRHAGRRASASAGAAARRRPRRPGAGELDDPARRPTAAASASAAARASGGLVLADDDDHRRRDRAERGRAVPRRRGPRGRRRVARGSVFIHSPNARS